MRTDCWPGRLPQRAAKVRSAPKIDPDNPYAPRPAHFDMPAKQVLVIFCPGAVSHVDTFDYKPALAQLHGQKPPGIPDVTFEGPTGNIAKPFWEFRPRGETGKMVSDLLPHLAEMVDDFCFFHSLTTDTSAHPAGRELHEHRLHDGRLSFLRSLDYLRPGDRKPGTPRLRRHQRPAGTGPQREEQLRQRVSSRGISGDGLQRPASPQQSAPTRITLSLRRPGHPSSCCSV